MALLIITFMSLTVAAVMSIIAWRVVHEERRRSEVRVATLASDIHGEPSSPVAVSESFFAEPHGTTHGPLRALGVGALVVGGLLALVVFASSQRSTTAGTAPAATVPSSAAVEPASAAPISLVALGHERDGDRLIVRGVVRIPAPGHDAGSLTALVSVLNRKGDIVASGSGPVTNALRTPGAGGVESTFVVTVPGAGEVSRFRVAFKDNDRIIAHLDRREHELP
jgi:hypothetical protein